MKRWRCIICGYVHMGETPPYVCPICNAPQKMFELIDDGNDRLLSKQAICRQLQTQ